MYNILLVDDTLQNLQVLSAMLKEHGYQVRGVQSGRMALTAANTKPPDLILLDIRMPEMDGYQVCQQLKADAHTRDIPVIFLSALDDIEDKVKAFEAGGVDYVTKPFQAEEVLARVETHLSLRALTLHLEEMVQARTGELDEAYRRLEQLERTKNSFYSVTAQDLLKPLKAIEGCAHLLEGNLIGCSDSAELETLVRSILDATGDLDQLVNGMLGATKITSADKEPFGEWLAKTLNERGWAMRELSRRIGFSAATVSRVLSGEQTPSQDFCQAVARALKVSEVEVAWRANLLTISDAAGLIELVKVMSTSPGGQDRASSVT